MAWIWALCLGYREGSEAGWSDQLFSNRAIAHANSFAPPELRQVRGEVIARSGWQFLIDTSHTHRAMYCLIPSLTLNAQHRRQVNLKHQSPKSPNAPAFRHSHRAQLGEGRDTGQERCLKPTNKPGETRPSCQYRAIGTSGQIRG